MMAPASPADRDEAARRTRLFLLLAAAIVAAQAATLYWLGRSPICTCGYVKLWEGNAFGPGNSQHLSDWYTPSHIVHGFIFYFFAWAVFRRSSVAWRFAFAVFIEAAWEVAENTPYVIDYYRNNTVSLGYVGDSIINSVMDVVWMSLGFLVAWRAPVLVTIALALALEATAAYVIRDNLTLNIVMFIHPFESIKAWQTAIGQ
ncbi:MAG TPA: DUF2585 domain-containing protein [Xanthobacteraceae bacterium]|nr:DUF2585 domain-containing protein [Xanthobacteraceae bacterium]